MTHSTDTDENAKNPNIDTDKKGSIPPKQDYPGKSESDVNKGKEFGGQAGPEPTRFGDWEKNGRCTDF